MSNSAGALRPKLAEHSLELRSAKRCAEALFVIFFILAISTLGLNRALSENRREYETRYQWYEDAGSMLGRDRALQAMSPALFEGLVLSALTTRPRDGEFEKQFPSIDSLSSLDEIDISHRPEDGSIEDWSGVPNQLWEFMYELQRSAVAFGEIAAEIVANEQKPDRRILLLNAAVEKTFANDEARRFLLEKVVEPLSRIDGKAEWPPDTKSDWIVFGIWPPNRGHEIRPPPGNSYSERFLIPSDSRFDKGFLYQNVGGINNSADVEKVLDATWQDAYSKFRSTPASDPQIGTPGGTSLRATDIVMLGGPILVVIQVFFAFFWVHYWTLRRNEQQANMPFVFPVFANPADPLYKPIPKGTIEVSQRLVWLLFLVMPVIVLSFAIVTRYDISVLIIKILPDGGSWIARALGQRRHDGLSMFLDAINVVCLLVSVMAMIQITTANRATTMAGLINTIIRRVALFVGLLLAISIWLWSSHIVSEGAHIGNTNLLNLLYWMSFGLTWLAAMLVSISYRTRLPLVVSLCGLLFFAAMFVSR